MWNVTGVPSLKFREGILPIFLHARLVISAIKKIIKNKEQFSLKQFVEVLNTTAGARSLLRYVVRLTQLLLVLPATSAAAERSFSALKRLKTYLRATMSQSRLNYIMILHCHQERLDRMDMKETAQDFITANEKRVKFFGNF